MNRGLVLRLASEDARRLLWCSDCLVNHPAVYFTRQQRINSSLKRTCIGSQGHVQICSHACLRWSDIERAGLKTLRLSCGMKDIDGHPVMLEIGPAAAANGARGIKVTVRTSPWDIFQRKSSMTGTMQLPSAKEILQSIAKSEKDGAATSLCPHASFNPEKWQMKLAPGHKREPCDISPNEDAVSKDFFSPRVNTTDSPFRHLCPLCEITTTNEAPAIKSQTPGLHTTTVAADAMPLTTGPGAAPDYFTTIRSH